MSSSRTKQAKNAGRGAAWETEKSMRRKGGRKSTGVYVRRYKPPFARRTTTHTDPEQQGRGAGGETACYLAVVAVIAVDCLFVDELTTPLSTKAKLCIHRYMNLYTLMCALWILCICICVYILYIDQSLIIYIHSMGK